MVEPDKQQERVQLTPQQQKARRMRSIAIALVLGALVILFYAYTIRYFGNIGQ
ncbi:CoxF protein [Notoacmeibacter sp. MSK16QG-6]|uniref:CoxF protein n=1 Tax=Notoacmeibacter sp. MSK16QG-6 TaxID=2957982 RepID=UPI00209D58F1|nr:CoxF protein [Notoacmeibacter sp. MSK16QG-6]MCP1198223.1 CoxF protein [Notoacmeibacter sp. MSK16QG-6]